MVNTRTLSLIILVACLLALASCATAPQPSATSPVTVEERSPVPGPKTRSEEQSTAAPDTDRPADSTAPSRETSLQGMDEKIVEYESGPAVVALLDNVEGHAAAGENSRAVAELERALRIEPKNPHLWQRLGLLYLAEEKWVQAIAMAKKSNVHATGNRYIQAENWRIIAKARNALGDKQGAKAALEKSGQLLR